MNFKLSRFFLPFFVILLTSGCASLKHTEPAPSLNDKIAILVTEEQLSGWSDLPMGAHRVPDSQVIVSGHQKGGAGGLLFGLVGLAVQSAANSAVGSSATENSRSSLQINITKDSQAIINELIDTPEYSSRFSSTIEDAPNYLKLTPAIIFTFHKDGKSRPFVYFKSSLINKTTKKTLWTTRYISSSGAAKTLEGPNSWSENQGKHLVENIYQNIQLLSEYMLKDIANPYPRNPEELHTVQGHFPFVKSKLQTVGFKLTEDENKIVYLPKLGDLVVFSGVNIMDKNFTSSKPMKEGDIGFKVIDE